ncbi:MAG: purine-nucleoside phosphorylase [Chitinophagaceae bacterium]
MSVLASIKETVDFIRRSYQHELEVGVILGSGLSSFSKEISVELEIPYADIPHFPVSTVQGHSGKLIFGTIQGKKVVAMSGRFHYYEGYDPQTIVFPVRVMKFLGIKLLMISNAAGGVNPDFNVGDLMIIRDHISFATPNPLVGANEDSLGARFPDMSEPYKKNLIHLAKNAAQSLGIHIHEGVYFGVTGPTYETRAEYRMIHQMGGDAVGMSTVQEVIAANHMGLPVFAMSVITDLGIRDDENVITHEEVLTAAKNAEPSFTAIFKAVIASV